MELKLSMSQNSRVKYFLFHCDGASITQLFNFYVKKFVFLDI